MCSIKTGESDTSGLLAQGVTERRTNGNSIVHAKNHRPKNVRLFILTNENDLEGATLPSC